MGVEEQARDEGNAQGYRDLRSKRPTVPSVPLRKSISNGTANQTSNPRAHDEGREKQPSELVGRARVLEVHGRESERRPWDATEHALQHDHTKGGNTQILQKLFKFYQGAQVLNNGLTEHRRVGLFYSLFMGSHAWLAHCEAC